MLRLGLAACIAALLMAAPSARAGGEIAGDPAAGFTGDAMPADGEGASAEAEFISGDPFGRRDYFQDGNRRGGQFGPGYYREGYYYSRRQHPDYWDYDRKRSRGTVWTLVGERVVVPLIPSDRDMRAMRATVSRVREIAREVGDDVRDELQWTGGRYDEPRTPLK